MERAVMARPRSVSKMNDKELLEFERAAIAERRLANARIAKIKTDRKERRSRLIAKAVTAVPRDEDITDAHRERARMVLEACQELSDEEWQLLIQPGSELRLIAKMINPKDPDSVFSSSYFLDNDTISDHKTNLGLIRHREYWYARTSIIAENTRKELKLREAPEYRGIPLADFDRVTSERARAALQNDQGDAAPPASDTVVKPAKRQ